MSSANRQRRGPVDVGDRERAAKRYTVERARSSLVLVRRIVGDVVNYYRQVMDCQENLEICQTRGSREQLEQAQREALQCVEKLQSCADELEHLGVELKDWRAGLIDFPAVIGGREIRLCWRHGEDTVGHWHEAGGDCGEREELVSLLAEVEHA